MSFRVNRKVFTVRSWNTSREKIDLRERRIPSSIRLLLNLITAQHSVGAYVTLDFHLPIHLKPAIRSSIQLFCLDIMELYQRQGMTLSLPLRSDMLQRMEE